MDIECGGLTFTSDFDSSNIAKVEFVPIEKNRELAEDKDAIVPDYEFNIWTRTDCAGTEFENNNRTWFHFGVKGGTSANHIKLNVCNINRQMKLYKQGMAAVYKISPGPGKWERVKNNWSYSWKDNAVVLTFGYEPSENLCSTTYFAFTYPFSFTDLQNTYINMEMRLKKYNIENISPGSNPDDIYYHRECLVKSLENRSIDLITISSYHGIISTRERKLNGLFPDNDIPRPFQFKGKKIIFLSARVHPGETPSSFVMNGVLKLLLNKSDPIATALRRLYVFKLVPMLNPDGVFRGCFRTDTRGVNLNRYYLNPSPKLHPSVFAARSLIVYYHCGCEITEHNDDDEIYLNDETLRTENVNIRDNSSVNVDELQQQSFEKHIDAEECREKLTPSENVVMSSINSEEEDLNVSVSKLRTSDDEPVRLAVDSIQIQADSDSSIPSQRRFSSCNVRASTTHKTMNLAKIKSESNLFLYLDFHAHASKRGIFMYGNHFDNISDKVDCMLLPKLMSINNQHFHYNSCNFSKRNMCTKDRDGLSKEGCGRVATSKITGLVRSYTLECNYNTGCMVNIIPPTPKPLGNRLLRPLLVPPKYTPRIYEEIGQALCVSILDMTGSNPNSRLETSQFRNLNGLKEALRLEIVASKVSLSSRKNKFVPLLSKSKKHLQDNRSTILNARMISKSSGQSECGENLKIMPKIKKMKSSKRKTSVCSHQIAAPHSSSSQQSSSSSLIGGGILSDGSSSAATIVVNGRSVANKTNKDGGISAATNKLMLVKNGSKRLKLLVESKAGRNIVSGKNKLAIIPTRKQKAKKSALRCSSSAQGSGDDVDNGGNRLSKLRKILGGGSVKKRKTSIMLKKKKKKSSRLV